MAIISIRNRPINHTPQRADLPESCVPYPFCMARSSHDCTRVRPIISKEAYPPPITFPKKLDKAYRAWRIITSAARSATRTLSRRWISGNFITFPFGSRCAELSCSTPLLICHLEDVIMDGMERYKGHNLAEMAEIFRLLVNPLVTSSSQAPC